MRLALLDLTGTIVNLVEVHENDERAAAYLQEHASRLVPVPETTPAPVNIGDMWDGANFVRRLPSVDERAALAALIDARTDQLRSEASAALFSQTSDGKDFATVGATLSARVKEIIAEGETIKSALVAAPTWEDLAAITDPRTI